MLHGVRFQPIQFVDEEIKTLHQHRFAIFQQTFPNYYFLSFLGTVEENEKCTSVPFYFT